MSDSKTMCSLVGRSIHCPQISIYERLNSLLLGLGYIKPPTTYEEADLSQTLCYYCNNGGLVSKKTTVCADCREEQATIREIVSDRNPEDLKDLIQQWLTNLMNDMVPGELLDVIRDLVVQLTKPFPSIDMVSMSKNQDKLQVIYVNYLIDLVTGVQLRPDLVIIILRTIKQFEEKGCAELQL